MVNYEKMLSLLLTACAKITLLSIKTYIKEDHTITFRDGRAVGANFSNVFRIVDSLNIPDLKKLEQQAKEIDSGALWFAETAESIRSGCFATHLGIVENIRIGVKMVNDNYSSGYRKDKLQEILAELSDNLKALQ